ncbi:MAG: hypothetical protein ACE10D_02200, partial [Planctomycetota bacterium]
MRTAIIVAVCLGLLPALAGAQDETAQKIEYRSYDVGALANYFEDAPMQDFGIGGPSKYAPREREDIEGRHVLEIDLLIELISSVIEPESWDVLEGAYIASSGEGRILLGTTPAIHGKIGAFVDYLTAQLSTRIRVECHLLSFDDESVDRLRTAGTLNALEGGYLDPQQVAALLTEAAKEGNLHESGSTSAYPSQRVAVRNTTRVHFLHDYDVEIAQAAQVADPITKVATEGFLCYVRPSLLNLRGEIGLNVLAQAGRVRKPIESFRLEGDELGTVDLPKFDYVTICASRAIMSGRTLAAVARRPYGRSGPALVALLVTAHREELPTPPNRLSHLHVGFLTSRGDQFGVGWKWERKEEQRRLVSPKLIPVEPWSGRTLEELMEFLRSTVQPRSWEDDAILNGIGTGLFVLQSPEVTTEVQRAVRALENAAKRSTRVEVRVYAVPEHERIGAGPYRDRAVIERLGGNASAALELRSVAFDVMRGRWGCFAAGTERNIVADYDVEVAQEARIADPVIGQVFSGMLVNVRPLPSRDGRVIELNMSLHLMQVDRESLGAKNHDAAANGMLHAPREHVS